tara:strand:+ start:2425 stop:3393 length:969 start_codon:yes stop_codon:yes gene_type:complete
MQILYVSVHEPLQYDEVSLFEELGANVHVGNKLGTKPGSPKMRPAAGTNVTWDESSLSQYDVIIVMHNWPALKRIYQAKSPGQRIIWRTIGQCVPRQERNVKAWCKDLEIIRYSPRERLIGPWYAGETEIIRFYKDEAQFEGWTGGGGINMIASRFGQRKLPDHELVAKALEPFDWKLYGRNEGHPKGAGFLDYDDLIPTLHASDVFVSAHSMPACYTLNLMEGMMSGAPVVTIGRSVLEQFTNHVPDAPGLPSAMFEVDEIITHGENGILISSPEQAQEDIRELLSDRKKAEDMGRKGRERAIELFGKAKIKEQWRQFLGL